MALDAPLRALKGVGPKVADVLAAAGLRTQRDLLFHFPTRHHTVVTVAGPCDEDVGQVVRFACVVRAVSFRYLPRRRSILVVTVAADDGVACQVAYFNQPYMRHAFAVDQVRVAEGTLVRRGDRFALSPGRLLVEAIGEDSPVRLRYPAIDGVSEERLRSLLRQALARVDLSCSPLPPLAPPLTDGRSPTFAAAVRAMHAPTDAAELEAARRFFALHEAVALFTAIDEQRRAREAASAPRVAFSAALEERLRARIPLQWTADQLDALARVRAALGGTQPMALLLQGDVGTGKTAVAVWAALAAVASGLQVAFLAPTELLAEQHFAKVGQWLQGSRVHTELLTGSLPRKARLLADTAVANGTARLVFGTHALLSAGTRFHRLGMVVIDEQHRFGVEQRQLLMRKGEHPHLLVLTATPIPRTLAYALFGDLAVAELRQRPGKRRIAVARHVRTHAWARVLRAMRWRLARGQRIFVVCPSIGEDGESGGALATHARLARQFPCELVHGRVPAGERLEIVRRFRAGAFGVLVGTTVLEVGLDVPEATLMVVVDAQRFGLATLHQLRGRVGRGVRRGVCLLLGTETARTRALCRTTDGFALAELDLALRGTGELLGLRQSGRGELRSLDPLADLELLTSARAAVRRADAPFSAASDGSGSS
ncbi:MAG: helicase-related protein [Planctomycetota bacterium]